MIHSRKVVALLPIKDHSERVKGKNFREFCGKPLYHHILSALERTYAVDEIVINTDSPRVVLEAPKLSSKVRVIERPAELCGDFVSMNRIIEHDLAQSAGDVYLQTHATNPLLRSETIAMALKAFAEQEEHDSLLTVNEFHSRFYFADGRPVNHDPENLIRTQDLPPLYEENSCLYLFTKESYGALKRRIGQNPMMYPTPAMESVDIDDEFAFRLAELLALYAQK
jgi:CMP-N-acetylneuraminic acid synthetase